MLILLAHGWILDAKLFHAESYVGSLWRPGAKLATTVNKNQSAGTVSRSNAKMADPG
jgi:hypothetical protein